MLDIDNEEQLNWICWIWICICTEKWDKVLKDYEYRL